jgi:hypothetical protein
MKVRFEFAPGPRVLRGVFEGVLDDAALRQGYSDARRYIAATDPAAGIWDLSGVSSFEITPDTVRDLARTQPAMGVVTAPRFVVVPSDLAFGMARMFQEIGDATRPQLFVVRSLEEAYQRLKIAPPKYEPVNL